MPSSASAANKPKKKVRARASKPPLLTLCAVLGVVAADQAAKFLVRKLLPLGSSRPVVPEVLYITHHGNTGAAFGLFDEKTAALTAVSLLFIAGILYYLFRRGRAVTHPAALALILAGAVGNTIDRLRLGYVTDFIDFRIWPIFNIADSAITAGVFIIAWSFLTKKLRA